MIVPLAMQRLQHRALMVHVYGRDSELALALGSLRATARLVRANQKLHPPPSTMVLASQFP